MRLGRLAGILGVAALDTVDVVGAASGSLSVSDTLVTGGSVVKRFDAVMNENCALTAALGALGVGKLEEVAMITDGKRADGGNNMILESEERTLGAAAVDGPFDIVMGFD